MFRKLMARLEQGPKDTFNPGEWNLPRGARVAFWVGGDGMTPVRVMAEAGTSWGEVEKELSRALGCRVRVRWERAETVDDVAIAPCGWL